MMTARHFSAAAAARIVAPGSNAPTRPFQEHAMHVQSETSSFTALRIAATVAAALASMLVVAAIARPEMMSMAMLRQLIVGFGL
jgi:hypothetical protein